MAGFTEATAVVPDGDGSYEAFVDAAWTIAGKPNGGYLLATMGRAAVASAAASGSPHEHALAASAHYLAAPEPGPVRIETETLRTGRSASQVRARLSQERSCVEALFILGDLDPASRAERAEGPPVPVPDERDCVAWRAERPSGQHIAIFDAVDVRLDPANLGFLDGRPERTAELRGWLRFADGHQADPLTLLYVVDAFPPATLDLGSSGWVPTFELTAYVRAVPARGPLRVRQHALHVEGGLVDEACEVWDSAGHLVARGMQLAGVRLAAPDRPLF